MDGFYSEKKMMKSGFRKIERDDLNELKLLKYESYEVTHGMFNSNDEEQTKWFQVISDSKNDTPMIYEDEGEKIGFYYIREIDWISRHHNFSYYVFPQHRGKGFGSVILNKGLQYSFDRLNMNKVYAHVLSTNKISLKLMTSVGFYPVGVLKNHVFKNGMYIDDNILEITKDIHINNKEG
jgi:[ribosomal protein S5]-alanine N-acetyltransferase|tara:strand:+ start:4586 stop:5125 length:540 start_codon:yes stop_codon:yes gene_type:complete